MDDGRYDIPRWRPRAASARYAAGCHADGSGAFGAIIAGLACIAALHAMNPHALIARVNIDRALAGAEYDGSYLAGLSPDAVPTLLARLDQLPEPERCRVARTL